MGPDIQERNVKEAELLGQRSPLACNICPIADAFIKDSQECYGESNMDLHVFLHSLSGGYGEFSKELRSFTAEKREWIQSKIKRLVGSDGSLNLSVHIAQPDNPSSRAILTVHHPSREKLVPCGSEMRALLLALMDSGNFDMSAYEARMWEFDINGKPKDDQAGYVYLLHGVGTHYYKIGHSNNLDRRISQISPVLPFPLELVSSIRSDHRQKLEAYMHRKFASKRLEGEWFALDKDDIALFDECGPEVNALDLFEMTDPLILDLGSDRLSHYPSDAPSVNEVVL